MNFRGSILVLAIWTLALVTSFTVSLGYAVRQKMALLSRFETEYSVFSVAMAGIEKFKGQLKTVSEEVEFTALSDPWFDNPKSFNNMGMPVGNFSVSYIMTSREGRNVTIYGVVDEERKINLNKASAQTISKIFQIAASLSESEAQSYAYNIVDWRDSDSFYGHPNFGAEDKDYDEMKYPYHAKNAAFETIEEIFLVKGMTLDLFNKISPYVTVYGEGAVNINTAPPEVLAALGFDSMMVGKILEYRRGVDREEGTLDDRFFQRAETIVQDLHNVIILNDIEKALLEKGASEGELDVKSSFFWVRSVGTLKGGRASIELQAIVVRPGKIVNCRIASRT